MSRLFALTSLVCLINLSAVADLSAQDLIISNVRIIVGNGEVIEQGSIVIRNGRIASVAGGAANAPGVRAIDARGMTAMPGFIDAHRHIMGGNADQWFKEQAAARMQEFLETGYTTLMSGGGPVPGIVQLKQRVEKGQIKGPRIITSGRADPSGFKTAEEARAQVQKLARAGVEIIIKLMGPNTAAFIEKSNDLGTLQPGKLADIVILAGNPLEGSWNLLNATVVIKGGDIVVDKR